jgi:hypothetical protein
MKIGAFRTAAFTGLLWATALGIPAIANAAGPPIENLSPPNGSVLTRAAGDKTPVLLQFTCPRFETSYHSEVTWTAYFVRVATSPEPNQEGRLSDAYTIDFLGAHPTNAAETTCAAEFPALYANSPRAYYWQVERVDCETSSCHDLGPVWSFQTAVSTPPVPAPSPAPVARPQVRAYVACGTGTNARPAHWCFPGKAGAFFRSNFNTRYSVCVVYPTRRRQCARNQFADAGVLYVNAIRTNLLGQHKVIWTVAGNQVVKYFRIVRR